MLVLASFESGSDEGKLNALDRAVSTAIPASSSSSTSPLAPMTKTFLISGLFRASQRAATKDDGTTWSSVTRSSPSPAKRLTYAALLFAALFVTKTHVLPSRSSISSVSTVLGSRPSSPRQSTPSQSKRKASWSARKDSA